MLRALEGQEVMVVFLEGKAMRGVLTGSEYCNLALWQRTGLAIMVCKHALKYIHTAPVE